MLRTTLGLMLCSLALAAPSQAGPLTTPFAIAFPDIPLPIPQPLPLPWPWPEHDEEEPKLAVDLDLPYSSNALPYRSFASVTELGRALTVKGLLDAVRLASDPQATLTRLALRLSRQGDFTHEVDRLQSGIDRDELSEAIRELEIEIGARPTAAAAESDSPESRSTLDVIVESLLPRPLFPLPRFGGWRFGR